MLLGDMAETRLSSVRVFLMKPAAENGDLSGS